MMRVEMVDSLLRRPRVIRWLWLALAGLLVPLHILPIALQWGKLESACRPVSSCPAYQLDAASANALAQHGISMAMYAGFTLVVSAVAILCWYSMSALIIHRKPDDRGAVVSSFFLLLFPIGGASIWINSNVGALFGDIALGSALLFGLLFPDGRFVPSWTRWIALALLPAMVLLVLPVDAVFALPILVIAVVAIWSQVYRFRRVSSWSQRQQTKWAVFGLLLGTIGLLGIINSYALLPASFSQNGTLYAGLTTSLLVILVTAIPISIGIAMLRSRLWDVDRVISRSLSYVLLTLSLVGIYVGSVIALQAIFRAITGQQSDIAIAISTLAIAALFNPLRRRFQTLIARTFYRSRYDASKVLAAFSAACRDETDLERLRQGLLDVLHETVQPGHASLWLREL